MKRIVNIVLMVSMLVLSSTAGISRQPGRFTLSGTIVGKEQGYIYLLLTDLFEKRIVDSALVENGRFVFSGTMPYTMMAILYGNADAKSAGDVNNTSFLLDPGETKVALKYGDFKGRQLLGAESQAALDSLERLQVDGQSKAALEKSFYDTHPSSFATAYLLRGRITSFTPDQQQHYYDSFSPEIQQSGFGKYIKSVIDKQKLGVPGTKALDFTASDINGNALKLSDYKGKYVLLDFWASWCVPCRRGNPHLRQLYSIYHPKGMEIIGVSDDDSRPEAWRAAVAKDSIGIWKHVLRGIDLEKMKAGDVNLNNHKNEISSSKYAVASLPTKVLINPEGVIVGRYGGGAQDEGELDKKLAALLK